MVREDLGTIVVTGPDRRQWLNGLLTCEVTDLESGHGRWGLSLSKPGKVLSEAFVVAGESALFVGVSESTAPTILDWFDSFLIMEDVEVSDASEELSWMFVYGDGAVGVARALSEGQKGWSSSDIDWSPGAGGLVVLPRSDSSLLATRVANQPSAKLATNEEWLAYRVRHLIPVYGKDFSDRQNPHEASLDRRAVSWTKGCYLGQEAVCMQDMRGKVKWRLVTLEFSDAETPDRASNIVSVGGAAAGEVTTLAVDPTDGRWIALARIRAKYAARGTAVEACSASAVVVESPPSS